MATLTREMDKKIKEGMRKGNANMKKTAAKATRITKIEKRSIEIDDQIIIPNVAMCIIHIAG